MLEQFATRFCSIMNGYDSTYETFCKSLDLLEDLYGEISEYRPRKNGSILLKKLLMREIEGEYHRIDGIICNKNGGEL